MIRRRLSNKETYLIEKKVDERYEIPGVINNANYSTREGKSHESCII